MKVRTLAPHCCACVPLHGCAQPRSRTTALSAYRCPLWARDPWVFDTAEQHNIRVSVVTKGLSHPWAVAFLPDGGMLVTERPGRLRIFRHGVLDPGCCFRHP